MEKYVTRHEWSKWVRYSEGLFISRCEHCDLKKYRRYKSSGNIHYSHYPKLKCTTRKIELNA